MTDPVQHARAFFEAHPEIDVLEAFIFALQRLEALTPFPRPTQANGGATRAAGGHDPIGANLFSKVPSHGPNSAYCWFECLTKTTASTAIRSPGEARRGNGTMVSVVTTTGPRARASRPRISRSPHPGSGTWKTTSLTRSESSAPTLSSRSRMPPTTATTCVRASAGCGTCPNKSRSACSETAIRRSRRATSQRGEASFAIGRSSRPLIRISPWGRRPRRATARGCPGRRRPEPS